MAAPQGYGQYARLRSARAGLGCQLLGAGRSHRLTRMSLFGVRPGQARYGVLPWAPPDGRPGTSTLHRDCVASTPLYWSVAHSCTSQPVETCALDIGAISFFSCVPPLLQGRRLTLWNTALLDFWKSKKRGRASLSHPMTPYEGRETSSASSCSESGCSLFARSTRRSLRGPSGVAETRPRAAR